MADLAEEAQKYGWNIAVFKSSKELYALLKRAIREEWTQARFVAKVQATKWYRGRPESARKAIALRASDPKEYKRQVQKMAMHIRSLSTKMYGKTGYAGKWLRGAAETAVMFGWTDEELEYQLAKHAEIGKMMSRDRLGGEAGQLEEQIQKWESDYGVKLSESWTAKRLREALLGQNDATSILQSIQKMAQARYRGFSKEIEMGRTVSDIAEPYRQSMARLLELNQESIDVFDGQIQKALTWTDGEEGTPNPKALWQFENDLRADPRWDKTNNARETFMGAGRRILSDMGLVG